jgi:hypothetical protein
MKKYQLRRIIKKIVTEAKLLETIKDPTKEEMMNFLHSLYGKEEDFRDSAEIAMYWFANFYHGGQSSNLYSTLSTSRFSPGPVAKGPEPHSMEEMMYEALVLEYAKGSEEAHEIQHKYNALNEELSPKNQEKIGNWLRELGSRKAAYKLVNVIITNRLGIGLEDLADTATLANGCDEIEEALKSGNFEKALRLAAETAKNFIDEEGGEGLMEGDEADAVNSMYDGNDDDLAAHGFKGELDRANKVFHPKQKSKSFFGKQKPKVKTVQDFDWERIKKALNKGTLKESDASQLTDPDEYRQWHSFKKQNQESDDNALYVEYVGPYGNEKPFTLKTANGVEKFEYCKGKYPSGKEDLAVYAYRGDLCYGYKAWKQQYNIKT